MRNASSNTRSPKLPTHIAYTVQDREGKKPFWQKIGGVFEHADHRGYSIQLSALPIDGRIVIRVPSASKPKQ